jgi:Cu-Zn family superoxide dismutase
MARRWIAAGAALTLAATGGAVLANTAGSSDVVVQPAAVSDAAAGSVTAAGAQLARAVLKDAAGRRVGIVTFRNHGRVTDVVAVFRKDANVAAGFHGFHIHANDLPDAGTGCVADPGGDPATWFLSADGHLANEGQTHGHHLGDMPSVLTLASGRARIAFQINKIPFGRLVGSAVMLHAGADNFGNVPLGSGSDQYRENDGSGGAAVVKTQKTGNAGNRVACGVIKKI